MKKMTTRELTLAALFVAVTAVLSQIVIPMPLVPFNLAVLEVFLCGALITAATWYFMPGNLVYCGVLTLLGASSLLLVPLAPVLERLPAQAGAAWSFVLFLLFHMSMNLVAIINPEAYNMICAFLGANWYALVGTAGLAALVVLHFVYALVLTVNNYRARGTQRYAVTVNEQGVEWASKNMLVLGVIVVVGLLLHLFNFWSKMQLVELTGAEGSMVGGNFVSAHDGAILIAYTFSQWYYVALYLVWLAALWLHLNHGIWSMFQTVGWANDTWYPRLKCIGKILSTVIVLGFAAVVVVYFVCSLRGYAAAVCEGACCAGL